MKNISAISNRQGALTAQEAASSWNGKRLTAEKKNILQSKGLSLQKMIQTSTFHSRVVAELKCEIEGILKERSIAPQEINASLSKINNLLHMMVCRSNNPGAWKDLGTRVFNTLKNVMDH